ncbi:MAG: hypothetical protein LBK82_04945 [Planctomycetaceae bacterium]|nr:hypothetical protein [Planctomycetaceae bacterium]
MKQKIDEWIEESKPRIDCSSKQAFRESVTGIKDSLSEQDKEKFKETIVALDRICVEISDETIDFGKVQGLISNELHRKTLQKINGEELQQKIDEWIKRSQQQVSPDTTTTTTTTKPELPTPNSAILNSEQEERAKYAEELFTSVAVDPADGNFYLLSDELLKNGARLTIIGNGYNEFRRASKDKNWLEMINLIHTEVYRYNWQRYNEYPNKENIDRVFTTFINNPRYQMDWKIQLILNSPERLRRDNNWIVPVSFHTFDAFKGAFRFNEVASGGDVDVNVSTLCFAANENKEWQPTNFGYSANWTGWYGKRCFFTTNVTAVRVAFYRRCLDWNRQLAAEIKSRQEKIKEGKLDPETAFNEMQDLYNSRLAEALKLCKNDGKQPIRIIEKKDNTEKKDDDDTPQ